MYNGLINVYKEAGMTSHDVVYKLRKILGQKKIGHTGTLDPDATGVLPVALGSATKLCELVADSPKEYRAVMKLGMTTDTQDMSGQVLTKVHADVEESVLRAAAAHFMGEIEQVPPMYSAVKVNGRKLYELARKGIEIERPARRVTIHSIEVHRIAPDEAQLVVRCAKGTYIRTLCADIGERIGCGACVRELVRTECGGFRIEDARTLPEIETLYEAGSLTGAVIAVDRMFPEAGRASVSPALDQRLYNGNQFTREELIFSEEGAAEQKKLRLYDSGGTFVGLYVWDARRRHYHPEKMFLPC